MTTRIVIFIIRIYQNTISPILGDTCRFHPSCSTYAILALKQHGFLKGMLRTSWRILRCNPFSKGGIDYP